MKCSRTLQAGFALCCAHSSVHSSLGWQQCCNESLCEDNRNVDPEDALLTLARLPCLDSNAVCKLVDNGVCRVNLSTGRLGTTKFAPQNWRQVVAHEIVQSTSCPICIDQVAVNLPRVRQRPLDSFLRHFCERDPLDAFALQHILQNSLLSSSLTALRCVA